MDDDQTILWFFYGVMKTFGFIIFGIYCLGATIAMPYYNWQFASNVGFLPWLFFGEIIASINALLWPIDVFYHFIFLPLHH